MPDTKALTITRHLKVELTAAEKNEKHEQLVRTLNDVKRLVSSFELIKEQHKANLKARQKDIDELSDDLGAGFLMKPVACEQTVDLAHNRMLTRRLDTGETIEDRALTVDELKSYGQTK